MSSHYLSRLFEPRSVAIVGATERAGAVGRVLVENMIAAGYKGELYGVNPAHKSVLGVPCYPSVPELPKRVDLAVVATRPEAVPNVIEACGRAGTKAAVIITAGFSETGIDGAERERRVLATARQYGVRLVGPNCLGIMRPAIGLNATFGHGNAVPGSLGLVSQSGAICTAMLDWARPNGIGFSSVVSLGGSADIDFGEIVDYLAFDPQTEHVLLYIEGIRDARRFVSALRAAARAKPIVVMKSGRHPTGVRAAVSHTGAMVGADDVFDAALRRTGAVRVTSLASGVGAAHALSKRVRPRGERLAIITNAGGPGVLAADRAADLGVPLADLSAATIEALRAALPPNWSQGNPIDVIGDADVARYTAALKACFADPGIDGVLVILTPQAMTAPTDVAKAVIECSRRSDKPLIACWMGEEQVVEGRALFQKRGIPVFRTPEPAVEMFANVSAFYRNQRSLMQTPGPLSEQEQPDFAAAKRIVDAALAAGATVLSGAQSKALLAAFHIPVARAVPARSAEEAVAVADTLGYPVVMKIDSPDITHKTEVGGVRLNLSGAEDVRAAFASMTEGVRQVRPQARILGVTLESFVSRANVRELFIGAIADPVFGPAITFGTGGTAVEIHADRAVGLPPLNGFLIDEMIRSTRVSRLLGAFRGMPPANVEAIGNVLLRVSEMVCELPWIRELDVNPLLADEHGVIAADARVVVAPRPASKRPYDHMAIHPYPVDLVSEWRARDGATVTIRPIRPEDARIEYEFVHELSPQTKYLRFMGAVRDLSPSMLARFTQVDYDREMALIGVVSQDDRDGRDGAQEAARDGKDGAQEAAREKQIAVARYVINPDGTSCEFAIVVAESWQGQGLARHLMAKLVELARERGLREMVGLILSTNTRMLDLARSLGFTIGDWPDDPELVRARLALS
ncbi:MAG TPA: GNAT family N-acetyltransferase [Burkholderiales bacterium]|nr:GNAT family N-acetyltransferase [Burkholderiales bacterium]